MYVISFCHLKNPAGQLQSSPPLNWDGSESWRGNLKATQLIGSLDSGLSDSQVQTHNYYPAQLPTD